MARKQLNLKLVGLDGNAFSLMGAFQKAARKGGWTPEEISETLKDAMSGDYSHLLGVLSQYTKD
jgi:NADH:ubiquinone oxidoreductase subunit E